MEKERWERVIKTGAEIAEELFVSRDATVCHPEIEKAVIEKENQQWVALDWLREKIVNRFGKEEDESNVGFNAGLKTILFLLEENHSEQG